MVANFSETNKYGVDLESLYHASIEALRLCEFKIENADIESGVIKAKTKLTWWSWTEKITIEIKKDGTVYAHSKCSYPLQVVAWGKNKKNVKAFFNNFKV